MLIRVKAIGVNFADLLQRMGVYPGRAQASFVPGLEVAGVVEKIVRRRPSEPERDLRGRAMPWLRSPRFNAYAEWVAVPASTSIRLPPGHAA